MCEIKHDVSAQTSSIAHKIWSEHVVPTTRMQECQVGSQGKDLRSSLADTTATQRVGDSVCIKQTTCGLQLVVEDAAAGVREEVDHEGEVVYGGQGHGRELVRLVQVVQVRHPAVEHQYHDVIYSEKAFTGSADSNEPAVHRDYYT